MFAPVNKNASLKTRLNKYLNETYYVGYDLDNYFTNKNQVMMFDRLFKCDANFKEKWTKGVYVIPEDKTSTMYLSSYINKKSLLKNASRKLLRYKYNDKLTKGAKNLLQGYMIEYSQDRIFTIDEKMDKLFCSIFNADVTANNKM